MKEVELQKKILQMFRERKIHCQRVIAFMPGESDLLACIAGKFVAIELKIAGGRQSDVQKIYQKKIEDSGGLYLLISSEENMTNWIDLLMKGADQ